MGRKRNRRLFAEALKDANREYAAAYTSEMCGKKEVYTDTSGVIACVGKRTILITVTSKEERFKAKVKNDPVLAAGLFVWLSQLLDTGPISFDEPEWYSEWY